MKFSFSLHFSFNILYVRQLTLQYIKLAYLKLIVCDNLIAVGEHLAVTEHIMGVQSVMRSV